MDLFTSSVVIIDSNQSITTQNSKISGKIARTVELHNFNSSLVLEPTYKIDDIEYLKSLLISTIEKTQSDYAAGIFTTFTSYTVSTKSTLTNVEEAIEFNNFHEGIHLGYILAMKNTIIPQ